LKNKLKSDAILLMQTNVFLDGLVFPEGPRWHNGRLWFSDMQGLDVMTVDPAGKVEKIIEVKGSPSGLGWLPDGRLQVVSMIDRRLLRLDAEGLVEVADLSHLASFHCNDMVMDHLGRAYIGNFGFDFAANAPVKPAEIVLVTPEGYARVVAEDLLFPNGAVITPDGQTFIVAETFGHRLTAFDIEGDGSLVNRRIWAKLNEAYPDGICLDAEGAIWVAALTRGMSFGFSIAAASPIVSPYRPDRMPACWAEKPVAPCLSAQRGWPFRMRFAALRAEKSK
jgi:sugar lactone lactonase YvrE